MSALHRRFHINLLNPLCREFGLQSNSPPYADGKTVASNKTKGEMDVEDIFTDSRIHKLLLNLSRSNFNLGKIYKQRFVQNQERSHYALMTDKMFNKVPFFKCLADYRKLGARYTRNPLRL